MSGNQHHQSFRPPVPWSALGVAPSVDPNAPVWLGSFRGSGDTLQKMREQVWGARGEKSLVVRTLTEEVIREVFPKDYLSEILAIRNWCTVNVRYTNDPLHVEWIKDPQRLAEEYFAQGRTLADCDESAELIATMALQCGRKAEFVVAGFGGQGAYSHVFTRVQEPKSGTWIVCDPVAGTDTPNMLRRITTYEIWSLDP